MIIEIILYIVVNPEGVTLSLSNKKTGNIVLLWIILHVLQFDLQRLGADVNFV